MFASSSSVPGNLRRIVARRFAMPLLLSIAALCAVNDASAQVPTPWSTNTLENDAISTKTEDQKRQEMARDSQGNTFIAWEDLGDANRVYIQKIAPTGETLWATNGVPVCTVTSKQEWPQIVSDGDNGIIVTWTDYRDSPDLNIFAQRVDGNGSFVWNETGVPVCLANGIQKEPRLISDGQYGAIITWQDGRVSTVNYDIYAQRINDSGDSEWEANGIIICNESGNQEFPQIISNGENGSYIAWIDKRLSGTAVPYIQHIDASGIVDQQLNGAGQRLWPVNGLSMTNRTTAQSKLVLVPGGNGSAIAVWQLGSTGTDIYAQKMDSSGNRLWGVGALFLTPVSESQLNPQAVSDGLGGVFLTWEYVRSTGTLKDIYAQHISEDGQALAAPIKVCDSARDQLTPKISLVEPGEAVISWQDKRLNQSDIYAQKIDSTGDIYWDANGKVVTAVLGDQLNPSIVPGLGGGAVISWQDIRNGNDYDIYASRVSADGTLGPPPPPASSGPAAPSNVSLLDDGDSLNLTWSDNATNETGYRILRSVNGADAEELAVLDANSTSYSDADINNCSIYEYTVAAYNNDGNAAAEPVEHDNTMQPTLTLHGDNPATIPYGRTYYDAGASGRDGCNNSLQVSVTQNTVDTSAIGSYTVAYSAIDAHGKTATASRTVNVVKANQTITFATLSDKTYGDAPITLSATSSSGLPVSLAVTGPATLTGSVLTLNAAGTVTVTATQAGNGNYNPAADVVRTFEIHKANASISVIGYTGTYDGQPHTATGTARGIEATPADLSSLLHITGTFTEIPGGTATWTFDGNENYNPSTGSASIIIRAISPLRPKPPVRP